MENDFDLSQDYILENDSVILRPLKTSDHEYLVQYAVNEPELWKFSLVSVAGSDNLKTYIDTALKAKEEKKEYPFIVFDKRTQKYAGCTRFYDIQIENKTLQLGYTWYGSKYHGSGLNKNCKYLLLEFAFERMGMERVEFRADNNNAKSIAAMKSIGCTVEGVLRKNVPLPDGKRRDSIILSILKEEWLEKIKDSFKNRL